MTEKSGRRWWRLAAMILVCVQLPVLARTAGDPQQSDFANYFTPAFVLARGGDVGALYDRDSFERALGQTGIEGLGSFVPHPPANALWLLPFASRPLHVAKVLWTIVLVLSIGLTIWGVLRLSPGFEPSVAIVLVLAPTLALRNSLAFGQPYLILLTLLVGGALALERGRPFLASFLLGLGVSFKPYALGVVFLFVHPARRRSLAGFLCGAIAPSLALLILAGPEPFIQFLSKVLPWMLRGEIQDPFSPGWGSGMALANRLLRFEPDLNPQPWFHAPLLARFLGAAVSTALLALGVFSSRRALDAGRPLDAVGIGLAFALGASPFVASYHLVLIVVPAVAVAARLRGRGLVLWLLGWAVLGSSLMNTFRSASGVLAPLAYLRFFGLLGLALMVSRPYLNRRMVGKALALGAFIGVLGLPWDRNEEDWTRIEPAKGYTMMRPYFCGANLRWWSPSKDGRRLESGGAGTDCSPSAKEALRQGAVVSRFTDGSWNLYLRSPGPANVLESRLTFSDANEVDPVWTPDGCAVVFASDQGRGLGSTALYLLDVSGLMAGCGGAGPAGGLR